MKKKICMLATNDIINDPRVQKEAVSAVKAGFDVYVIGALSARAVEREKKDGYTIIRVNTGQETKKVETFNDKFKDFFKTNPTAYWLDKNIFKKFNNFYEKNRKAYFASEPNVGDSFYHMVTNVNLEEESAIRSYIDTVNLGFQGIIKEIMPDIVHCNDLDSLQSGWISKEVLNIKVLYDAHEYWTDIHVPKSPEWIKYFKDLEAKTIKSADAVISVNDSIGGLLEKDYGIKYTSTVYNCPFYEEVDRGLKGDLREIAGDKVIVLFQGRFETYRGLEELIEAAPLLNDNIVVFVRGYGLLEDYIKKNIREKGLEKRIVLVEPVKMHEMTKSAAQADIGLVPYIPNSFNSLYCTPNKVFEYTMAGLALVVTDAPELKKVAETGGHGVWCDPKNIKEFAEKINYLASDKERLSKMQENALKIAKEQYNWEHEAKKLIKIYEDILKSENGHNR